MKNYQVLIIDNSKKDGEDLAALLQDAGYFPQTASGGEQGISLINELPIALVILDHENLPDRGIEIIKEISEIDPGLHQIIHSRDMSFDSAIEALRRIAAMRQQVKGTAQTVERRIECDVRLAQ